MVSPYFTRTMDQGTLAMKNVQPTTHKYTLSVVMIVKNEADNLPVSLASIADWVDEIIVLDSGSTDNTKSIVEQYGGKWFINTDWQGFGKQRQIAQSYATGDWILALDADEEVSSTLKKSILSVINTEPKQTVYGIKRLDFIFGHQIDSPLWPVKAHWRLYPKHYQYNNNKVHEAVELNTASTSVLTGFLHHHTAKNPHFWLSKRLEYAHVWARERHQKNKKINIISIIAKSFWALIKQYLIDGRFLQGKYGFIYACLFSQYTFNKYTLLYDYNHKKETYELNFEPHNINKETVFTRPLPPKIQNKQYRISVVMIVKNEQKHLPACLYNIYDIADEIIILDSGSSDSTQKIAEHFGAIWHVKEQWEGFGIQRQTAQHYATGDYILMLDADEQLDDQLKAAIQSTAQQPPNNDKVFAVKRHNMFCGEAVHGNAWYCDHIVRFYANQHFNYHPYDVHESVNTQHATVITLDGKMQHFTNDNVHHYMLKNVGYSHIWATEKHTKHKASTSWISLPFRAFFSWFREYVLRGAFLGGSYGFFLASVAAEYNFNKYLMLIEKKYDDNPTKKN